MKDKLSINIKIDNRTFPLVIDRKDEERYRYAAKLLDEMVFEYRKNFKNRATEDILTMAAFQFVLRYVNLKSDTDYTQFINELKNLNDDINDFLSEK